MAKMNFEVYLLVKYLKNYLSVLANIGLTMDLSRKSAINVYIRFLILQYIDIFIVKLLYSFY